jgi:hypothetical protein
VKRICTGLYWPEPLQEALKRKTFDVVVSTHGRLRHVAEAIKGHTQRPVSVEGEAIFKGWLKVTGPDMLQTQEPSPIPIPEERFLEEPGPTTLSIACLRRSD